MEKSIEKIWEEGFLKSDALVAPRLNDLYNKKSIHLIDSFKRMFRINLIAIIVGSLLFLALSFVMGIPVMGIGFFLTLAVIVVVNKRLSDGLDNIDKSESSYHYIKAFDDWIKTQVSVNKRMATFYYPSFFLSLILGFWYANFDGQQAGQALMDRLFSSYPDMYLIFGMPVIVLLTVILMTGLFAYLGGRIYSWDLKMVYGSILAKLDEIIADMEELRR